MSNSIFEWVVVVSAALFLSLLWCNQRKLSRLTIRTANEIGAMRAAVEIAAPTKGD